MSEIKFGAGSVPSAQVASEAPATPATPTAAPSVPAVQGNRAVGRPTSNLASGDFVPSFAEIILPNVNLAHAVGDLGTNFPHGSIVFNQQTAIFIPLKLDKNNAVVQQATPPVTMTVLGWRPNPQCPADPTKFVEKVPGGGRGAICQTEEEVRAAGGTTDWGEWNLKKASGMKKFDFMATALVVIERPEFIADDGKLFNFEIDGKKIVLAWWNLKGSAYTEACKRVLFHARKMGCLRSGGFPSWSFSVSSFYKSYSGGAAAWVPVFVPNKQSTPAMLAFAQEVLGTGTAPTPAVEVAPDAE